MSSRHPTTIMALLLTSACEPDLATTNSDPSAGAFRVGQPAAVEFQWRTAADHVLAGASVLPDVTGDGIADAVIAAYPATASAASLYLIAGPLRRSLVIPGDEVATIPDATLVASGDADGDGRTDLVVETYEGLDVNRWSLASPLEGAVVPKGVGTPWTGMAADFNGDGILDRYELGWSYERSQAEYAVTFGPESRFSAAPDLQLHVSCAASEEGGFSTSLEYVHHLGDVDGDGWDEVQLRGQNQLCGTWTVPLTGASVLDAAKDAESVYGLSDLTPVGDQSADGLDDFFAAFDGVYVAPIVATGMSLSQARTIPAPELLELRPLANDLDGDGMTDFLGIDGSIEAGEVLEPVPGPIQSTSGECLVVVRGGEALANPKYEMCWDVAGLQVNFTSGVFEEDGVVSVLVLGDSVMVVDLSL